MFHRSKEKYKIKLENVIYVIKRKQMYHKLWDAISMISTGTYTEPQLLLKKPGKEKEPITSSVRQRKKTKR